MKKSILIICLAIICNLFALYAEENVSLKTLLLEMIDRENLAKYPQPSFSTKQFSSYSRESKEKDGKGWFANDDWSMFLRVDNKQGREEFVMFDAEGPGAVVRWWMTFGGKEPGQGTVRIYIDNMDTPVVVSNPFDLLSGNALVGSPLAASVSEKTDYHMRGHNLYLPIPYASRCVITYESKNLFKDKPGLGLPDGEAVYYNINYRTYSHDVKVKSFSYAELKKNKSVIANVQSKLKATNEKEIDKKNSYVNLNAQLLPGQEKQIIIKGSKAIKQLTMRLMAADREQALRSTVLKVAFDGEQTIWSPIGDFYGIGYKQLNSNNWYTKTNIDGLMNAFWVMPFQNECVISIVNHGNQTIDISDAFALYDQWKWDSNSMHFGASWQQHTRVTAHFPYYCSDLNFVTLKGKGVYIGDAVAIFNTTRGWWGEGDEKIYVDDEKFPSHFGTGTEDYYGYAWCQPQAFINHPFIAQPIGDGSFDYASSVNGRYRSLDKIPFNQSIKFYMELYQYYVKARWNYATIAFWYMLPGGTSSIEEDIAGATEPVAKNRSNVYTPELKLVIEGESLLPTITGGKIDYQTAFKELWSDAMQLFWYEAHPGDQAELNFYSSFSGKFNLKGFFTKASDYGIFNIYLNDQLIFEKLNLYNNYVTMSEAQANEVQLKEGKNTLKVKVVSTDPNIMYCFGVDKLVFSVIK